MGGTQVSSRTRMSLCLCHLKVSDDNFTNLQIQGMPPHVTNLFRMQQLKSLKSKSQIFAVN